MCYTTVTTYHIVLIVQQAVLIRVMNKFSSIEGSGYSSKLLAT